MSEPILVTGAQLAILLQVTPAALSKAVRNGHRCGGYDVGAWAERGKNGRVKGYNIARETMWALMMGAVSPGNALDLQDKTPELPAKRDFCGGSVPTRQQAAGIPKLEPRRRSTHETTHDPGVLPSTGGLRGAATTVQPSREELIGELLALLIQRYQPHIQQFLKKCWNAAQSGGSTQPSGANR